MTLSEILSRTPSKPHQPSVLLMLALASLGMLGLITKRAQPWPSAWIDGPAFVLLIVAALFFRLETRRVAAVGWLIPAMTALCITAIALQWVGGVSNFSGDALVAVLYVGAFFLSFLCGAMLEKSPNANALKSCFWGGLVAGSIVSTAIAVVQWAGVPTHEPWFGDFSPGSRPFANFAQPNQFCTLVFLGVCGLFWFFETGAICRLTLLLGVSLLAFGMLISGARAGILEAAVLMLVGLGVYWRTARSEAGSAKPKVILAVLVVVLLVILVVLSGQLSGRTVLGMADAGTRPGYWRSMLDALGRAPWLGYGWLQTAKAQLVVALDYPLHTAVFDYSHNLFLDLLLWNGLPLGGLICLVLTGWVVQRIRCCQSRTAVWFLIASLGVMAHGMVEYPLAYAYFLLPVGIAMGVTEAAEGEGRWQGSHPVLVPLLVSVTLAFSLTALAYRDVEARFRNMRVVNERSPLPDESFARLEGGTLDQLDAWITIFGWPAREAMTADELRFMERVAERYPYPHVLNRYALALGLNGDAAHATAMLQRLCHIHSHQHCLDAEDNWVALQQRFPVLQAAPFPR